MLELTRPKEHPQTQAGYLASLVHCKMLSSKLCKSITNSNEILKASDEEIRYGLGLRAGWQSRDCYKISRTV